MKVLFDTNVILDTLLARQPFAPLSAALIARVERHELGGLLCATTVTTIDYLAARQLGTSGARQAILGLLRAFEVAPVTRAVLEGALALSVKDFEDAVLAEAARLADADAIVTRDPAGFRSIGLTVYSPGELEAALNG